MIGPGRSPCERPERLPREASGRGHLPCPEAAKPWVLTATILGSAMAFIDGSVVNVALPALQRSLDASVVEMQWVVNAYALFLGALILVGGAAGDRYGRRRIFLLGVVLFGLASVLCGLATSAMALVAARALQGVGGALLVPSSLAILTAVFDEGERGRAIGTWSGFSALTTAFGPVLGGWLVDTWSWRPIFFLNVPMAVVTVALALWAVPAEVADGAAGDDGEEGRGGTRGLDWPGAAAATLGLGALVFGLVQAGERGVRSPEAWGPALVGVLLCGVFLAIEARVADPMVPLTMFRDRSFAGANAITLLLYFALGGVFFFLPFNLIQAQGYSALEAGAAFLPFTLIMAVLSRWSGGLVDRYGARLPLVVGPVLTAVGFALFAVLGSRPSGYWAGVFPAVLVSGLGMAVSVAPLTTVVMGAASRERAGTASGINNAVARTAGLLAVAVLGALALAWFGPALETELAHREVPEPVREAVLTQRLQLAAAEPPDGVSAPVAAAVRSAVDTAFFASYRGIMLVAALLALGAAGVAAWTLPGRAPRS